MTDPQTRAVAQAIYDYFRKEGGVIHELDEGMRFAVDGMYLLDDLANAAINASYAPLIPDFVAALREIVESKECHEEWYRAIAREALKLYEPVLSLRNKTLPKTKFALGDRVGMIDRHKKGHDWRTGRIQAINICKHYGSLHVVYLVDYDDRIRSKGWDVHYRDEELELEAIIAMHEENMQLMRKAFGLLFDVKQREGL